MSIQGQVHSQLQMGCLHKLGGEITTNVPGFLTRRGEKEKAGGESEFAVKTTSCQASLKK